MVRLLDAAHVPIPHHITFNASLNPRLYRARASNIGPPLLQRAGLIDAEAKGAGVLFRVPKKLSGVCARCVAVCAVG